MDEHTLFLEGLRLHGKGWKQIASMIQSRTVVQIRTHAQKYFQKLSKVQQTSGGKSVGEVFMDTRPSTAATNAPNPHDANAATVRAEAALAAASAASAAASAALAASFHGEASDKRHCKASGHRGRKAGARGGAGASSGASSPASPRQRKRKASSADEAAAAGGLSPRGVVAVVTVPASSGSRSRPSKRHAAKADAPKKALLEAVASPSPNSIVGMDKLFSVDALGQASHLPVAIPPMGLGPQALQPLHPFSNPVVVVGGGHQHAVTGGGASSSAAWFSRAEEDADDAAALLMQDDLDWFSGHEPSAFLPPAQRSAAGLAFEATTGGLNANANSSEDAYESGSDDSEARHSVPIVAAPAPNPAAALGALAQPTAQKHQPPLSLTLQPSPFATTARVVPLAHAPLALPGAPGADTGPASAPLPSALKPQAMKQAAASDNAALDLLDANVFEDDHFDEEAFVSEFLGDAIDAF